MMGDLTMGNEGWREARDEMGRSVWINLSLARMIRRDSRKNCTWISFDKDHAVAVVDGVAALIDGAARSTSRRPHDFDELTELTSSARRPRA
jgi:hypothetical protein